jgi:hypothetical protein
VFIDQEVVAAKKEVGPKVYPKPFIYQPMWRSMRNKKEEERTWRR